MSTWPNTKGDRRLWAGLAAVNVAAVIFGTTALFGKLAVAPVWIVAVRGLFAALTLFALALSRRAPLRMTRQDLARTGATGVLLALHWVSFFMSVQKAGVAVATLTFATFPLMIVLIEAAMRRRMPAAFELSAGAAIVAAVFLLVGRGLPEAAAGPQGALAGLFSALCFAVFSIGSARLGKHLNPITLSLYQNVAVVAVMLPLLPFAARAPHALDWAVIAVLGIVATALMHQLYFFALKKLPAAVCGGFVALEPVYAIVFAAVLFAEPVSGTVVFSGALIVGASLLLLWRSETAASAVP